MGFNEMDFSDSTSLGIMGTETMENISEGVSAMFSTESKDVAPIKEEKPKKEKEAKIDNIEEDSFSMGPEKSALLSTKDDEEDEPEKEGPTFKEEEDEIVEDPEKEEPVVNTFSDLAKDLYDAGIFSLDEGEEEAPEITSPEQLLEKFQGVGRKIAHKEINSFFNQAGEDAYNAVKAIIIDKVDPEAYFKSAMKVESISSLDLQEESNQEFIVKKYYKSLGWEEDRVQKRVEKLKDYGDLEDESQLAQEKLVETEKELIATEQQRKQQDLMQKEQNRQKYAESIGGLLEQGLKSKDFGGIPVNEDTAGKVNSFMTQLKWTLPKTGENITDFDKLLMDLKSEQNYDKAVKIALLEANNWDFSKIKTKAISQESNKLFQRALQKEKVDKRSSPTDNFII